MKSNCCHPGLCFLTLEWPDIFVPKGIGIVAEAAMFYAGCAGVAATNLQITTQQSGGMKAGKPVSFGRHIDKIADAYVAFKLKSTEGMEKMIYS